MLNELIRQMKEQGLMSVAPIRFIGKAKPTFEMLAIMANTEPEDTNLTLWAWRMWRVRN